MELTSTPSQTRVVTAHKNEESAVLINDKLELKGGFGAKGCTIWQTFNQPNELGEKDISHDGLHFFTRGSLIRAVEFPPKSQGHNHRTISLDYGIVVEGEIELALEDGSKTLVRPGEVVVQQATMHQWNNLSDKPCRMIFILLDTEAPIIGGKPLEHAGLPSFAIHRAE